MFNRKKYKKDALAQLKGQWKNCVIISIFCALVVLVIELPEIISKTAEFFLEDSSISYLATSYNSSGILEIISYFVCFILGSANAFVALKISNGEKIKIDDFFKGLENFLKAIQAGFFFGLFTFLWSLLFFIPGIVKCYSYCLTQFIINEYPKIGGNKAVTLSKIMMNGHKGDIFVMFLSFLGWIILSCVTFGIGFIFLSPYMVVSFANAYKDIKSMALRSGVIVPEDFESESKN